MSALQRLPRLWLPLLLIITPTLVMAQEPATKAAPKRLLVLGTSPPAARAALDSGTFEGRVGGHGRRADDYLLRALELDSASGYIRAEYATYFSTLSQAERLRELDRAVLDAARAPTPELLMAVALREGMRGDEAMARAIAGVVLAKLPDDPNVFATSIWGLTPAQDAPLLEEYLARNPEQACGYRHLAYSYYQTGKSAEALATVQHYLQMLPDHPTAHAAYGNLLQWTGKLDQAQQEYRRTLELDSTFTAAYSGLAQIAEEHRDYKAARAMFETGLRHATAPLERHDLLNALAFAAAFAGDEKTMLAALPRAIAEADTVGADGASWSHAFLATFEAALGNGRAAREHLALVTGMPAPRTALAAVIVSALTGSPADVDGGVAAVERALPADSDLISLAHVIAAASRGEVTETRTALAAVKSPANAALGQVFLLRAARRAGDAQTVKAAKAEVGKYTTPDWFGALAQLMVRTK